MGFYNPRWVFIQERSYQIVAHEIAYVRGPHYIHIPLSQILPHANRQPSKLLGERGGMVEVSIYGLRMDVRCDL